VCQSYSKPKVGRSLRHSVVWPQCFTGDNNGSRWLSHVDRGQHSDGVRLLIAVVAFCLRQSSMTWWSETSWTRTMNFSCSLISQLLLCALWSCLIYQIATSQLVMSGAPFLFPVLPLFIILLPPNPHLFSLFSSILSPFPVLLLLCFPSPFPTSLSLIPNSSLSCCPFQYQKAITWGCTNRPLYQHIAGLEFLAGCYFYFQLPIQLYSSTTVSHLAIWAAVELLFSSWDRKI